MGSEREGGQSQGEISAPVTCFGYRFVKIDVQDPYLVSLSLLCSSSSSSSSTSSSSSSSSFSLWGPLTDVHGSHGVRDWKELRFGSRRNRKPAHNTQHRVLIYPLESKRSHRKKVMQLLFPPSDVTFPSVSRMTSPGTDIIQSEGCFPFQSGSCSLWNREL